MRCLTCLTSLCLSAYDPDPKDLLLLLKILRELLAVHQVSIEPLLSRIEEEEYVHVSTLHNFYPGQLEAPTEILRCHKNPIEPP